MSNLELFIIGCNWLYTGVVLIIIVNLSMRHKEHRLVGHQAQTSWTHQAGLSNIEKDKNTGQRAGKELIWLFDQLPFPAESSGSHKVSSHQRNMLHLVCPCTKKLGWNIGNPLFWMLSLTPFPDLSVYKEGGVHTTGSLFSFFIGMALFSEGNLAL